MREDRITGNRPRTLKRTRLGPVMKVLFIKRRKIMHAIYQKAKAKERRLELDRTREHQALLAQFQANAARIEEQNLQLKEQDETIKILRADKKTLVPLLDLLNSELDNSLETETDDNNDSGIVQEECMNDFVIPEDNFNEPGTMEETEAGLAPSVEMTKKSMNKPKGEGDVAHDDSFAVDGVEGGEADKKKKKKKKPSVGATPKETPKDDKKSRRGPSAKQLEAIKEFQRKAKEEEERILREEEEKERLHEEAENLRLEKLRLEQEKKERKKQKEKEKKERLKAEGKFLTAKQRADRQRAQSMLDALRAQGVDVPEVGGEVEKRTRAGTRIRKKNQVQSQLSIEEDAVAQKEDSAASAPASESTSAESIEPPKEEVVEERIKDTWDEESDEEESNSASSNEAATQPAGATNTKSQVQSKNAKNGNAHAEGSTESESEDGSGDASEYSSSETEHKTDAEKKRIKAAARIQKRREENDKARSLDSLRAPVVCVLGHVDTGKTKILDKLRRTHVQDGEAGGITQQIGATNVPIDAVKDQCKLVKNFSDINLKIPGLLIIDTPGHESFSNLRSRGSSLCDIAILVVDIMHGLEPQTIESINLLKSKKTPFVVALNKIDRLYDWQATMGRKDVRDVLKSQPKNTILEFEKRTNEVIVQFAEQGLNAALFDQNPDIKEYISMIPTSAFTGEGMGNMMALIVELSQNMLAKRLMYSKELQATVLEVKAIPGLGTTIDVILLNGALREGDTLIVAGTDGPIVTQIRSLLTPQPMKELRVKSAYIEYKEIKGAIGVKIAGKDLEKAIAGLNVQVALHPDEIDICREEVALELKSALSSIRLQDRGVFVQASTLGSLEALLEFLRTSSIPYAGIRIGPVVKKDVMKASIMLEHDSQYAVILAFDVKIERDAQDLSDNLGVRIFQADIIYHLFDKFTAYRDELKAKKRDEFKHVAVFPCKLKILPQFIFNTRDPIIVGVMVEAGIVREGTPLCVPNADFVEIGRVSSIEMNHKQLDCAKKGQEVCIKIEPIPGQAPKLLGRHFEETDLIVSKITRESIDACKEYFRNDLAKSDWQLMVELKKLFDIL